MAKFEPWNNEPIIISQPLKGKLVEKFYSKIEFADLLYVAANECIRLAEDYYCEIPFPKKFKFLIEDTRYPMKCDQKTNSIIVSEACIHDLEGAISIVLREDGFYWSDLHLTPFGKTDQFTAIQLMGGIYGWTNLVLEGNSQFPFPPFIITGPRAPLGYDWQSQERIKLAEMEIIPI